MDEVLLTIAIPTYNRENLLARCLTALAQEFGGRAEVEIIVSNNASTDGTAQLVSSIQSSLIPSLRYLENAINQGADFNISQCFREARGKYVWIFSDDDLLLPSYGLPVLNLLSSGEWGVVHLKSLWYSGNQVPQAAPAEMLHQVFPQSVDFIRQVHYWVTFITGNIINKKVLADSELTYTFNGTNLVQLGWVLPAIFKGLPNILIISKIIVCLTENSGGYKFFQTFATSFNLVMRSLISRGVMTSLTRHIINEKLITEYFPYSFTANRTSYSKESAIRILYREFSGYKSFWTDMLPKYYRFNNSHVFIKTKSILRGLVKRIK